MDLRKLGNEIRQVRTEQNKTQAEVADRARISRSLMSRIESGIASPSVLTLADVLRVLGRELKMEKRDDL